MTKFRNLLVLPKKEHSVLAAIEERELCILKDFPVKALSRCAMAESGLFAFIAAKGRRISFIKLNEELKIEKQFSFLLPPTYRAISLVFKDTILYTGGGGNKECLGYIDCSQELLTWCEISVPFEIMKYGKAIDDLLIDGNRLIAVDDIVAPKYLLTYDISEPANIHFQQICELKSNGTYELIHKAVINSNYIALLSSTQGMAGTGWHINILDTKSFSHLMELHSRRNMYNVFESEEDVPGSLQFHDMAFVADKLVIASGKAGITVVSNIDRGQYTMKTYYPQNMIIGSIERVYYIDNSRALVCVVHAGQEYKYGIMDDRL